MWRQAFINSPLTLTPTQINSPFKHLKKSLLNFWDWELSLVKSIWLPFKIVFFFNELMLINKKQKMTETYSYLDCKCKYYISM